MNGHSIMVCSCQQNHSEDRRPRERPVSYPAPSEFLSRNLPSNSNSSHPFRGRLGHTWLGAICCPPFLTLHARYHTSNIRERRCNSNGGYSGLVAGGDGSGKGWRGTSTRLFGSVGVKIDTEGFNRESCVNNSTPRVVIRPDLPQYLLSMRDFSVVKPSSNAIAWPGSIPRVSSPVHCSFVLTVPWAQGLRIIEVG